MQKQTIAITATFTAELIEESLSYWMQELCIPFNIEFAPYNQVFQQLLDPASLLSTNQHGANVILVRFEDWGKIKGDDEAGSYFSVIAYEDIERNVRDLLLALKSAKDRSATAHLVCLCPASRASVTDQKLTLFFRKMEDLMTLELRGLSGIHLVTTSELADVYPVVPYDDPQANKLGHIPYTQAFFTSLGTIIARKIHTLKSAPYKVIALDCDQTLWKGVCGEDGAHGIEIDPPRKALQEFMVTQYQAGMLICLCSKNNEEDVVEVFEQRSEMPLKRDHIVAWRINWDAKSDNLKALSEELQLGLDSFIFIDDDPVSCGEVQVNCPEVLTIQLPQESSRIPGLLKHVWAFDRLKITGEDEKRTALYKRKSERERVRKESHSFESFLASLGLKIQISELQPQNIDRVSQLTQRTNQFNFTTLRRSEGEIQALCRAGKSECLVVMVSDRFGDYGLVGVIIFRAGSEAIDVDTFLLSCRALGRGVEQQMLAELGEIAKKRGLDHVDVTFIDSGKNRPALDFLEGVGANCKKAIEGGCFFRFTAEFAATVRYSPEPAEPAAAGNSSEQPTPTISSIDSDGGTRSRSALLSRIVTELYSAEKVLGVLESQKQRVRPELAEAYTAPRTPIEEVVANIWSEVLRLKHVGIHDNFFALGGHSLQATQVISRVREAMQIELPLRSLFEAPSVAGLARNIETSRLTAQGSQAPPMITVARDKELPLSFAQQRLWFLNQLEPGGTSYNIPQAIRVSGVLNLAVLEQSLNEIVRRHESLRTTFAMMDGRPVQVVAESRSVLIPVVDIHQLPQAEREAETQRLVREREEAQRPFDLTQGPLLRASLVRLQEEEHVLLLTMHHVISDAWSMSVLFRELAALYGAFLTERGSPLAELSIQYVDYAVWQREWLQGGVLQKQLGYWKQRLAGAPAMLELPTDRPRPAVRSYQGAHQSVVLAKSLAEKLKALSQREGATLFMTLLAAFKTLLSRYTAQDNIVVGSPIAGRNRVEVENLIGFFVNTLVLRTDLSGDPTFRELLERVREVALGAYSHQDVPFENLVEELQTERDLSYSPLFQVMFTLQNVPQQALELAGLRLRPLDVDTGTAKFDLTLSMVEGADGLSGQMEYSTDLFDPCTITRMLGHFQILLEGIVADPEQRLSELPLLTEAERHQLLIDFNAPKREYPRGECLHQLFEQQVERAPDAVAVVYQHEQLSYRELNGRANKLAHYLRGLGVGPEVLVGICLERSVEMVVGLLGVLKAGGAYVPLDPSYPQERLSFMLTDTGAPVLLTQARVVKDLPDHRAEVICLDTDWDEIAQESEENLARGATAENLAYLIFTSGSTGQPKGVLISHYNVTRLFDATQELFNFSDGDVWTLFHSCAFDFSVWELWGALLYGGRLVVVPYLTSRSPEEFYDLLCREQVTILNQTPSAFHQLMHVEQFPGAAKELALRLVIFGGEALEVQSLKPWFDRHGDEHPLLINMYGITETTVHVTYRPLTAADLNAAPRSVTGRPISDLQVYVLDQQRRPVPIGVPGEIYVGGAGLARGYLNCPELTAERFVPDPFRSEDGARLYKSGDLARYLPDGDIEYLGRIDHQVKVRGFRIELGEIEAVLSGHQGVHTSVVIAREDAPGDKRLIAYLVVEQGQSPSISELRSFLKQKLPEYMVPSAFVMLGEMPLTPNGKVDRRALPEAPNCCLKSETGYLAPRTEVEQKIAAVWRETLGVEKVGINDNFFDLGGHSILIVHVHSKLLRALNVDLSIVNMFQYPTISSLAKYLSEELSEQASYQDVKSRAKRQKEALARQKKITREVMTHG